MPGISRQQGADKTVVPGVYPPRRRYVVPGIEERLPVVPEKVLDRGGAGLVAADMKNKLAHWIAVCPVKA
jgi:hypothetical protein